MELNLGEIIRQKIRSDGRTAKVICEELGMSRGNLDKIYHKESINSDLLAKISLSLGYDFFKHVNPFRKSELEQGGAANWNQGNPDEIGYNSVHHQLRDCTQQLERCQQELNFLRTGVEDAKRSLSDKEEIISLMKDKLKTQQAMIDTLQSDLEDCKSRSGS